MEPTDDLDLKVIDFEVFKACVSWAEHMVRATREGLTIKVLKPNVLAQFGHELMRDHPLMRQGTRILRFPCSARELSALKRATDGMFIHTVDVVVLNAEIQDAKAIDHGAPPIEANMAALNAGQKALQEEFEEAPQITAPATAALSEGASAREAHQAVGKNLNDKKHKHHREAAARIPGLWEELKSQYPDITKTNAARTISKKVHLAESTVLRHLKRLQ